ncbi:SoxR reducing system RseC family protein [Thauera phenylacetica]|jgi:sigma-E factor negative regulatory protein RseC|nr:SoxR reducing system RseC family protein [Thauera phenylacetica]HRM68622.1 SoxR reducing system RseC family protein [Thauera phenylacetica]
MMEARARILRIENGQAWVKLSGKQGGCGRCDEPGGCGSVQLSHAFGMPKDEFSMPVDTRFAVGDAVVIRIPDGAPLRAALASYGLGTLLLLVGAALGSLTGGAQHGDAWGLAGAVAGLALAWVINRVLPRSRSWRNSLSMELSVEEDCSRRLRVLQ